MDRFSARRRGYTAGRVVDFIDFQWFPIQCRRHGNHDGGGLLVLASWLAEQQARTRTQRWCRHDVETVPSALAGEVLEIGSWP